MEFYSDPMQTRHVYFYSGSRIDSLDLMVVNPESLVLHYKGRCDKCWYKEFEFTSKHILKVN